MFFKFKFKADRIHPHYKILRYSFLLLSLLVLLWGFGMCVFVLLACLGLGLCEGVRGSGDGWMDGIVWEGENELIDRCRLEEGKVEDGWMEMYFFFLCSKRDARLERG